MLQWERWMSETVKRGGRFVFLREQLPKSAEQFASTVIISGKDLIDKTCATTVQDTVFIFESQIAILEKIDSCLQGQRILVGTKASDWIDSGWVDAVIPTLDEDIWDDALDRADSLFHKTLPDFRSTQGQPCLFLDRDDVVVKNVPYNKDPEQVVLSVGIVDLINKAHAKSWWVALVTNQSGLGRGKINWEEYQKVHQRMLKLLAAQGAWLDETVWAGHIEDAPHAAGDSFASLRKPRPGMFQQVDDKLKVDRSKSIMIGDSASDVMAAYHAGIGNIYLLATERAETEVEKLQKAAKSLPAMKFNHLSDFSKIIF